GTLNTYTVGVSGDGGETIAPAVSQTISYQGTATFSVSAVTGYTLSTTVGGTCAPGSWNGSSYTTGPVPSDCAVPSNATLNAFSVPGGPRDCRKTISPSGGQSVGYGSPRACTVTPTSGYSVQTAVGGTCPAGSWSAGVYTTGAITADCT